MQNAINYADFPMNTSLRQLRAFLAVAECGQFTRAAHELDLSQSSLSATIRELEQSLNVRLFDRHTRMLQLTKAGSEFLPVVRRLVQELDDVVGTMRSHATLERGRVIVAAPGLQSALWLPDEIAAFSGQHPSIQVVLHDVPEREVTGLVQSGAADIGLVTTPRLPSDLRAQPFETDSFGAVVRPEDPLAKKKVLQWRDLDSIDLVGLVAGSPMRQALDEALLTHNIRLTYAYEVSQPLTMVGLVRAGLGTALVTSLMHPLAKWMGLELRPLMEPTVSRELMLIHSRERSLSPAAHQFYEQMTRRERKK